MEASIIGTRRGAAFPGFPAEALTFFRSLRRNNRREWFQARKATYDEKVRGPMVALVEALNAEMIKFAPDYVNEPKAAIYRVYRDTRFSNDKTPYKTHIGAIFPRHGLVKHCCAGFYCAVSDKELEIAGGVYMPTPDELRAIRLHLAGNYEECRKLTGDRKLRELMGELQGDKLSRVPKGFPKEHPAEELLRGKQWLFYQILDPALATTPQLLPEVVRRFRAMTPFLDFLNRPLVTRKKALPTLLT